MLKLVCNPDGDYLDLECHSGSISPEALLAWYEYPVGVVHNRQFRMHQFRMKCANPQVGADSVVYKEEQDA